MAKNRDLRNRPLAGLGLTEAQLRELTVISHGIPVASRATFFAKVADQLRGRMIGDGALHRTAFAVARTLAFNRPTSAIS